MAAPIGPGDWVECVSGSVSSSPTDKGCTFSIGRIYQVEEAGHYGPKRQDYLVIVGMYSPHPTRGWLASAFRPIYRPKADLIESLKAPPKQALVKRALEPAGRAHDARRTASSGRPY